MSEGRDPRRALASLLLAAIGTVLLAACSDEPREERAPEPELTPRDVRFSTPSSEDDPFFLHPDFQARMEAPGEEPETLSHRPGATPWQPVPEPIPNEVRMGAPTPDFLLDRLADFVARRDEPGAEGPDTATRIRRLDDSTGVGAVLRHGFPDDSVAGEVWYLELELNSQGWFVKAAAHRWTCWRGVSGDLCV